MYRGGHHESTPRRDVQQTMKFGLKGALHIWHGQAISRLWMIQHHCLVARVRSILF